MNCAIISIYSTPYGMAATNRILAYSKGLVSNGAVVTIYNPFPTDRIITLKRHPHTAVFDGVKYKYTSGRYLSKYKIIRGIYRLSGLKRVIGYITSFISLIIDNRKTKINILIISTDSIRDIIIYCIISGLIKSKVVFIFDEYPTPIRHKLKVRIPFWKTFSYRLILRKVNAYISISEKLGDFYNHISPHRTFILPVIIDVCRFESNEVICSLQNTNAGYICYMGNMELAKDDVDNIVKAFSIITTDFEDIQLHLYGSPSLEDKLLLDNLIISLNLENKVILKGKAQYEEVPRILKSAKVLVSSQPNTLRAEGGFPTKLGEYLASGIPALFTNVGENSKYVINNKHLFFVEPENPSVYAACLRHILQHYIESLIVAKNGKQFVWENYSHVAQGKRLFNFLNSL